MAGESMGQHGPAKQQCPCDCGIASVTIGHQDACCVIHDGEPGELFKRESMGLGHFIAMYRRRLLVISDNIKNIGMSNI